jgi:hypothetical protein
MIVSGILEDELFSHFIHGILDPNFNLHSNIDDTSYEDFLELFSKNMFFLWMILNYVTQEYMFRIIIQKLLGIDMSYILSFNVYIEMICQKVVWIQEIRNDSRFIERACYSHKKVIKLFNTLRFTTDNSIYDDTSTLHNNEQYSHHQL